MEIRRSGKKMIAYFDGIDRPLGSPEQYGEIYVSSQQKEDGRASVVEESVGSEFWSKVFVYLVSSETA